MMDTVNAVPIFLTFACLAGLTVALLVIARIFTPRQFIGPVQKMPYESGMNPIHDTRRRFDVRFHLVAIAFLVFDVEVLFLYPWAVAAKRPSATVAAEAMLTLPCQISSLSYQISVRRSTGPMHRPSANVR